MVSHWGRGVVGSTLRCPIGVKGFWVSGLWCWVSILVSQWDDGVIGSTLRCPIGVKRFWVSGLWCPIGVEGVLGLIGSAMKELLGLVVIGSPWGLGRRAVGAPSLAAGQR